MRDSTGSSGTGVRPAELLERALFEVQKVVVGQDRMVERMLVALLARGHVLLEGVPGVAKSLAVDTLARVVGGSWVRLQFTPDLVPSDLVGTRIYRADGHGFDTEKGPVFCNLLLADEINRAPAKVQSALLEVMQERQVTIGKQTFPVPDPFLVLATMNPIESEGTYPLPEAQVDRFMMKVLVDYPTPREELEVVRRSLLPVDEVEQVLDVDELHRFQAAAGKVFVDQPVAEYAVSLVNATRHFDKVGLGHLSAFVDYGASPRASLNLVHGARSLALLRGRTYALPHDVTDLAPDVLRHRLVLSYQALAEGVAPDRIVETVLQTIQQPRIDLTRAAAVPA